MLPLWAAGLDMSTNPRKEWWTAITRGENSQGPPRLVDLHSGIGSAAMVERLTERSYATAAVEVPFGWPGAFSSLVAAHARGPLPIGDLSGISPIQPETGLSRSIRIGGGAGLQPIA
jgi:hypothetical protein